MAAPATRQPTRKPTSQRTRQPTHETRQTKPASDLVPAAAIDSARPYASAETLETVLLDHEDMAAHDDIFARIADAVKPEDFLEEIWVRDVVALVWEAFRLRRLKAGLMESGACGGLTRVLSSLSYAAPRDIAAGWARGDGERVKQVEGLLRQARLTMEHVMAETLADRIEDIERIDRMIASAEQRRSAMLREIDRHRASLAARLRLASDDVVQAEFEEVAPGRGQ